jgi:hypothetical protein
MNHQQCFMIKELQSAEEARASPDRLSRFKQMGCSNPPLGPTNLFYQIMGQHSLYVITNVFFGLRRSGPDLRYQQRNDLIYDADNGIVTSR